MIRTSAIERIGCACVTTRLHSLQYESIRYEAYSTKRIVREHAVRLPLEQSDSYTAYPPYLVVSIQGTQYRGNEVTEAYSTKPAAVWAVHYASGVHDFKAAIANIWRTSRTSYVTPERAVSVDPLVYQVQIGGDAVIR